jgi:hypothetical protein
VNWKGYGRKRPWFNLIYYPSICLDWMKKVAKHAVNDRQSPEWELNPKALEYEARFPITREIRSVTHYYPRHLYKNCKLQFPAALLKTFAINWGNLDILLRSVACFTLRPHWYRGVSRMHDRGGGLIKQPVWMRRQTDTSCPSRERKSA